GVIGALLAATTRGLSNDIFFQVGLLTTIGLSAKNAILIVEFAKELFDKGMGIKQAVIEASRMRLRPILMTTLTTVIAMVPMAFFPGDGGEMMQPIGITMVGGLLSGAVMTLFVTPIMYHLFNKRRERRFDDPESLQNMLATYEP
ncbi:MAG TPA: efflux RND transporter permease subunit, partial [Treponemataceae bacterium]|nr:efflux RND transporter permease subunit [Treponemataceae bacterium]